MKLARRAGSTSARRAFVVRSRSSSQLHRVNGVLGRTRPFCKSLSLSVSLSTLFCSSRSWHCCDKQLGARGRVCAWVGHPAGYRLWATALTELHSSVSDSIISICCGFAVQHVVRQVHNRSPQQVVRQIASLATSCIGLQNLLHSKSTTNSQQVACNNQQVVQQVAQLVVQRIHS